MRDCPACRVPLHGYEDVCPSCGTEQVPIKSGGGRTPYGAGWKPEEPQVNWTPFIAAFVVAAGVIFFLASQTWVGQVLQGKNKPPADPLNGMTYIQARDAIDQQLTQGLQSAGAKKVKITWKAAAGGTGAPTERQADAPVDVSVDTSLPDPNSHKEVIEPVKQYMDRAKIQSLTMTDAHSHATWTYNVSEASPAPASEEGQ